MYIRTSTCTLYTKHGRFHIFELKAANPKMYFACNFFNGRIPGWKKSIQKISSVLKVFSYLHNKKPIKL